MPFDMDDMKSGSAWLLKSPVLGVALGVVAVVLLVLSVRGLNEHLPELPVVRLPMATKKDFPVAKIEALLSKDTFTKTKVAANGTHAFFTRYFEPPPPPPKPVPPPESVPVPAPKPPPPTTRKAALLYQGVYEGAAGGKKAFMLVEGTLQVLTNGAKVIADWSIADIAVRKLTLTNQAAQTNVLDFNAPKELEVPIK